MKRLIVILVPVIVVVAVALLVIIFAMPKVAAAPAPVPAGKLMSIESYVSLNIATLSSVKASAGGKFYTTSMQAAGGKGIVSFEDGHNSYVADFTYEMSDQTGIHVTSFTVRQ